MHAIVLQKCKTSMYFKENCTKFILTCCNLENSAVVMDDTKQGTAIIKNLSLTRTAGES